MIIVNSQINTHLQTEPNFLFKKKLNLKTKESPKNLLRRFELTVNTTTTTASASTTDSAPLSSSRSSSSSSS